MDAEGALAEGYRDLRDRFVFTVDPADAKDFDDAVSIEPVFDLSSGESGRGRPCSDSPALLNSPLGCSSRAELRAGPPPAFSGCVDSVEVPYWRIGVHIADVSHYVPWGSAVDLDARKRATSVYLVDRVIPMLPEKLSNDVCSLRPGEARRTMTIDMIVDVRGEVVDAKAYSALICSNARLAYEEAQAVLDGRESLGEELDGRIAQLSRIAKQRDALRKQAGGLDFDTVEAKVRLDSDGYPVDVDLREKTDATQLIEEAMIMANEAVARYLRDAGFPCLSRVHEQPGRDALAVADKDGNGGSHLPVAGRRRNRPYLSVGAVDRVVDEPHAVSKACTFVQHGIDIAADGGTRLAAGLAAAHPVCNAKDECLWIGDKMVLVFTAHEPAFARESDVGLEFALCAYESEKHGVYSPFAGLRYCEGARIRRKSQDTTSRRIHDCRSRRDHPRS